MVKHVAAGEEQDGDEADGGPEVAALQEGEDIGASDGSEGDGTEDGGGGDDELDPVKGTDEWGCRERGEAAGDPVVDWLCGVDAVGGVRRGCGVGEVWCMRVWCRRA